MAHHQSARQPDHRQSSAALRGVLLMRASWNLWFVFTLLSAGRLSFADTVERFSRFALVDGLLAFTMAIGYVVVSPRRQLWLSPATDGSTRIGLVLIAAGGAGVASFPLTAILYVGLIATFAFADGLIDLVEGMSLRTEFGTRGGWLPLAASGLFAMTVGACLFTLDADATVLRNLIGALSAVHALALLSALRHVRQLLVRPIADVDVPRRATLTR